MYCSWKPVFLFLIPLMNTSAFLLPSRIAPAKSFNVLQKAHQLTITTIEGETKTVPIEDYQSILEAAEDAGMELPHDCRLGTCLACAAKIESGQIDQSGGTLDDSVMEAGFALTCQSYAKSDVKLTCVEENQLIDEQFVAHKL